MKTYVLGGRTGWRALATANLDAGAALRAHGDGTYHSEALDGAVARCRWDRLRLDAALPAGTSAAFRAYASDVDRGAAAIEALGDADFADCGTVEGPFGGTTDTLLTTAPGRYLWLRVALTGTPRDAAELRGIRVDFPRDTTLRMLPAVWSTDGGGRDLNERFLALFDAMRDGVLREIRALGSVIDPRTTDAAAKRDFLDWLGTWFGLEIFRAWPEARRRAVIAHAGELFRLRGTARGIRRFVELALGLDIVILEGWANRHWWFAGGGRLGCGVLFGPGIAGRAAFDGTTVLDTNRIASNPAPVRDPFASRANRMTVLVPFAGTPSADALAMLRAVIEAQKPAHVAVCIDVVQPHARLGVASHLGLDAVVGKLRPPDILPGFVPPRLGVNATVGDGP